MGFQSAAGFSTASTVTSVPISKPSGVVAGWFMVATITARGSTVSAAPSGWTLVRTTAGTGFTVYTYTKIAGGSEPGSYSWTITDANYHVGSICAYDNVSSVRSHDGTAGSSASGVYAAPSLTATAGDILYCAFAFDHGTPGAVAVSTPTGMTERVEAATWAISHAADDETRATAGATGTRSATCGAGTFNSAAHSLLLVTNVAPNAPTITTLTGATTIDLAETNRGQWTFSDADAGDSQSKFDLRYREDGGGAWTDVTGVTPNSFYDFVGGTFTAGDWEWQVRTYDAAGLVGPYSSSSFFTAAAVPDVPSITDPTNGSTISAEDDAITWSAPSQDSYQVRKVADSAGSPDTGTVYYDSGEVVSAVARTAALTFPTNNRTEHLQVRINDDGLWSPWASISVNVSYTQPAQPSIVVDDTSEPGAIQVQATHPTPTGGEPTVSYMDVWRRRAKVDANGNFVEWYDTERDPGGENGFPHRDGFEIAPSAIFTDWFVNGSGYSYRVRAVGANGTSSYSEWSDDGSGEVVDEIDGGAPDTVYDDELDGGGP